MSSIRTIERLIANAERRRKEATRDVQKVEEELAKLREKLAEAELEASQLPLPLPNKTRGLSDKWTTVLNFMSLRAPHPVSVDDILNFAAENKLQVSRAAVRAQLHNYEKRGFLERVSDGVYLATAAARAYCDY